MSTGIAERPTAAGTTPFTRAVHVSAVPGPRRRRGDLLRECALLVVCYLLYSAGRLLADSDPVAAATAARRLLAVEGALALDVEGWVNRSASATAFLAVPASYWYAALHYTVTPAVLVWLWRRHPLGYAADRTALAVATGLGLIGFWLLPMTPPRLLGAGHVDTLAVYSGWGWWGAEASAPRGLGGLTNQLAAMPSLHVGWAVWVAWVLWRRGSRPLGWLGVVYAVGTVVVVVATGNHWVLDAVAGAAVVAVGVAVTRGAYRARGRVMH